MIPENENLFEVSIRVHGVEWVVVFAYFDETEGKNKDFFAVAGYLFDEAGVSTFRRLYKERLEHRLPVNEHGRRIFHASPIYWGDKEFAQYSRPVREYWLSLMAQILSETAKMGVVVGVESKDYAQGLQNSIFKVERQGKPVDSLASWVGSPYSLCLFRCVEGINEWMEQQGIAGPVEYTMEAGRARENTEAAAIFARLSSEALRDRFRVGGYRFVPKAPETPWLFGADYFAWWWQANHHVSAQHVIPPDGWQRPVVPLLENVPHRGVYLTEASIGIHAMINAFYGLMGP